MSISSMVEPREQVASGVPTTFAAAVKRLCVACVTWRMEQCAAAVLRALNDRELSDIGLTRADITGAANEEGADDHLHRPALALRQPLTRRS